MNRFFMLFVGLALWLPSQAKDVHVNGYTKKDGTYVAPYTRTSPNHTKSDNYSTKGNVNPYTGKEGSKKDDNAPTSDSPSKATASDQSAHAPSNWEKLKPGMTKAEVTALLGEPNIKSESKWLYSNQGTVVYDAKGLTK